MEDYKEKYKQALERAKNYHKGHTLDVNPQAAMEYVFPELKESKDERIRKGLINTFSIYYKDEPDGEWDGKPVKDIIAWLEKQGEQKANEIHSIFRVGDYIRNKKTSDKVLIEQLDVKSKAYYYTSYDGGAEIHSDFPFSKQDEWELIGQKIVEHKSVWREDDERYMNTLLWIIEAYRKNGFGETHEQNAVKSENWLKSIEERMKGE